MQHFFNCLNIKECRLGKEQCVIRLFRYFEEKRGDILCQYITLCSNIALIQKGGVAQAGDKLLFEQTVGLKRFDNRVREGDMHFCILWNLSGGIEFIGIAVTGECPSYCIEIAVAIVRIGLKVRALCPLIPGIDNNVPFPFIECLSGIVYKMLEPLLKALRSRVVNEIGIFAVACSIIPGGNNGSEIGKGFDIYLVFIKRGNFIIR